MTAITLSSHSSYLLLPLVTVHVPPAGDQEDDTTRNDLWPRAGKNAHAFVVFIPCAVYGTEYL